MTCTMTKRYHYDDDNYFLNDNYFLTKTMRFEYHEICSLPKLSWLAVMEEENSIIKVHHGAMVECRPDSFVAGIWDGDFQTTDFCESHAFQGTGACLQKLSGGITFATPNHLQESIYSIRIEHTLYLSNSVAFILAFTGRDLDADYYDYEYDLNSIFYGTKRCVRELKLNVGNLRMHRYCNIVIDESLNIEEIQKREPAPFVDYDDYKSRITDVINRMLINASDEERKCKYRSVTTISRGYDATATSALVHDLGCDTALTFNEPGKYVEDSGEEVAKTLGYSMIVTGNGSAYMQNTGLWEAESASSGDVGCLVAFNIFEERYKDSVLFLGLKGDSIWGRDESDANNDFDFIKMTIAAEQNPEHYLRNNTIAVSVPLLMASQWPSIYKIGNSDEMKSYSVGGHYDRPIPRRIAEEKGVPREAFGMKKSGAGFTYRFNPTLSSLKGKMSDTSYRSLCDFSQRVKRNGWKKMCHEFKYYRINYPIYLGYIANRLGIRYRTQPKEYVSSVTSSLLILWGMDTMKNRYKEALGSETESS